jgi:hypothetical protein
MVISKAIPVAVLAVACAGGLAAGCNRALPTAAPTPAPTPVPTPEPAPTPVVIYGCGLVRGTGDGHNCPREAPSFQAELDAAIDKVIAEHPDWFDLRRQRGTGLYPVRNVPAYVDEVVENLRKAGLCALNDGEEIAVKRSNRFNDQFDIITSDAFVRRSYRTTCYPAWHVIPPAGDNS